MNPPRHTGLVISERLFDTLLTLYPHPFRAAHADQMRLSFQAACRDADGRGGLIALWLPTVFDLIKTALEERARQGEISMSKERFVALAGPLTIVIGLMWATASIGEFVLLVGWGSPDSFWDFWWFFPVMPSFLVMIPAFMGTRLRYQESATPLGRLGLVLSVAGGAGMILFLVVGIVLGLMGIEQETWPNFVIEALFLTPMIGHILFGIDALRLKLLPRWNVLPLLVGLPSVLLVVPHVIANPVYFGIATGLPRNFHLILIVTFLRYSLAGIAWVLMGYVMLDRREGQSTTVTAVKTVTTVTTE